MVAGLHSFAKIRSAPAERIFCPTFISMPTHQHLPVTLPFPTPRQEVFDLLQGIWDRNWLTNEGPVHQEFEATLAKELGIEHFKLVGNGTIALQLAYQALCLEGEVITTPISYVATVSSLAWERCTPVFVDVLESTLCIDHAAIEAAVTPRTTAIVATHCYGLPCDVDAIRAIALSLIHISEPTRPY